MSINSNLAESELKDCFIGTLSEHFKRKQLKQGL